MTGAAVPSENATHDDVAAAVIAVSEDDTVIERDTWRSTNGKIIKTTPIKENLMAPFFSRSCAIYHVVETNELQPVAL